MLLKSRTVNFVKCLRQFHRTCPQLLHTIFSEDDGKKIIEYVNNMCETDVSRLRYPPKRLTNVIDFQKKNGPIMELNDLLEIKDFDSGPALKLCKAILKVIESKDHTSSDTEIKSNIRTTKASSINPCKITKPALDTTWQGIQNFASVSITSQSVYYTVFEQRDCWASQHVTDWNLCDIQRGGSNKWDLPDMILNLKDSFPNVGAYLFMEGRSVSSNKQQTHAFQDQQKHQLYGALICLICSRGNFGPDAGRGIFHMKSGASARMFDLFVGNEVISPQHVLAEHLQGHSSSTALPKFSNSLKEVLFERHLIERFLSEKLESREFFSRSFVLGKAFVEGLKKIEKQLK